MRQGLAGGMAFSKVAGEDYASYSFGAQFAEVRVDPLLRTVRVARMVGVFGCGRIINPRTARSNLIGGMIWGASFALLEQTQIDRPKRARFANTDLAGYHFATNADIGEVIVETVDGATETSTRSVPRASARSASSACRRPSPTRSTTRRAYGCARHRSWWRTFCLDRESLAARVIARAGLRAPICVIFLCHGLVIGGWATQVPVLQARLALSPLQLGGALFCISAGALALMPLAGGLVARHGPGRVIRAGALAASTSFLLASLAPDLTALCACLVVFGMGFGTVDVAMNAELVRVEQQAGRPILGSVHAMWSIGSAAGSGGGAALLLALPPGAQAGVLAALSLGAILAASVSLGPAIPAARGEPSRPWRSLRLLLIGAVLCAAFAVEGGVADWSGVYLRTIRHVPAAGAALGYTAFSVCMVAMRFAGDRLRREAGDAAMLAGALAAALGIALVLAAPGRAWPLAGFGLVGAGVANVVPALFALAGMSAAASPPAAISVVATLGYAGVLAGPPLLGAVAQAASLGTSIGLLGLLCLAIACSPLWLGLRGGRRTLRHCR